MGRGATRQKRAPPRRLFRRLQIPLRRRRPRAPRGVEAPGSPDGDVTVEALCLARAQVGDLPLAQLQLAAARCGSAAPRPRCRRRARTRPGSRSRGRRSAAPCASSVRSSGSSTTSMSCGRTKCSPSRLTSPTKLITNSLAGCVVEVVGGARLLDPAFVHHDQLLGDVHRLLLVVGDEDRRHVHLLVEAAQPGAQVLADLGVERAEGLVEQQHLRLRPPAPGPAPCAGAGRRRAGTG